jgi:CRISPR-associated protein Cmr4
MYKNAKPLFLICETPLHAGSGSDLGIVDLPIQRERHTNFPKIESSSLKGALREAFETTFSKDITYNNRLNVHRTFGHDKDGIRKSDKTDIETYFGDNTQFAGCLAFTDARLLLYPVKSLYGVFAWVTCPRVIKKFVSDLGITDLEIGFNTEGVVENTTPQGCVDLFQDVNSEKKKVYLEEYIFNEITPEAEEGNLTKMAKWLSEKAFIGYDQYWIEKVAKDIIVLNDVDFRDFVTLTTEVVTRTKINNETGTVQDGALFSEEYLPAESVMYSMVMFADEFTSKESKLKAKKASDDTEGGVLEFFQSGLDANKNIVQIGGNATLGKGIVRTKLISEPVKQVPQNVKN